jgi:AmpE protein
MIFLIVLIAFLLERFFHWRHWRHWHWVMHYERLVSARMDGLPPWLVLSVIVLPFLLMIGMLQHLFTGVWGGSLQFIISFVVLLYCLGPDNLWVQAYHCINQLNKQDPAAINHARTTFGMASTDNPQTFHRAFVRAIFVAAHQRIFAVFFWFVLLGPVGAVAYRIIESISTQPISSAKIAAQIKGVLDWLPIRLTTFIFALGGHFNSVFAYWKSEALTGPDTNEQFLTECGIAALDVVENNQLPETGLAEQEALALIDRVFIIGLLLIAIVVLLN